MVHGSPRERGPGCAAWALPTAAPWPDLALGTRACPGTAGGGCQGRSRYRWVGTSVGLGLALVPGRGGPRSSEVLGVRRAASGDGPGAWGLRSPLWPRARRIHGRPGPTTPMASGRGGGRPREADGGRGEARVKPGATGRAPLRLVAARPQRARAGRARPGPPQAGGGTAST